MLYKKKLGEKGKDKRKMQKTVERILKGERYKERNESRRKQ